MNTYQRRTRRINSLSLPPSVNGRSNPTKSRRPKRFKCNTCFKRFSSKHCLTEHSYKHTDAKPYCCQVCQQQFRHASQFTLHKREHNFPQKYFWPRLENVDCLNLELPEPQLPSEDRIQLALLCEQTIKELPTFEEAFRMTLNSLN